MVLYTVTGKVGEEGYLDIAKSGDLTGKNIYVNMTNKCPCSCVFCLRQTKKPIIRPIGIPIRERSSACLLMIFLI